MLHCPECGTTLESGADVSFTETDATIGFIESAKRFYRRSRPSATGLVPEVLHTANCAHCGRTLGSGVAGARGNAGAV